MPCVKGCPWHKMWDGLGNTCAPAAWRSLGALEAEGFTLCTDKLGVWTSTAPRPCMTHKTG